MRRAVLLWALCVAGLASASGWLGLRGVVAHADEAFGAPTFYWAPRTDAPSPRARGRSCEQAAREHLFAHAPLYGLEPHELSHAPLRSLHDTGQGARVASFQAWALGRPVFRHELRVVMDAEYRLVALAGFLPREAFGAAALRRGALDARSALALTLAAQTGERLPLSAWAERGAHGPFDRFYEAGPRKGRVREVAFASPGRLELAFHVELETEGAALSYVLSSVDGRLLYARNLVEHASFSYRVWGGPDGPLDGPQGNQAAPHPTGRPDGYQPSFAPPALVTLPYGPISRQDAWLAGGVTETRGNNADAYADLSAPDGFSTGDVRATTTAPGVFDRTYDVARDPQATRDQTLAAVTQLFYTVNFLHDVYYDLGFDEAAGNAQDDNFARGGLGSDALRAEAQDYNGRNNANMTTPADGNRPRLQLFLFDAIAATVAVTQPVSQARVFNAAVADFGAQTFDLTGALVLVDDGTAPAADGCQTPFANAAAVAGKVALVERGNCLITDKVANAQAAGAVAVLVANNVSGPAPRLVGTNATVTVPALSLTQDDGAVLRGALSQGLTVRLARAPAPDRDCALDNAVVAHEWGHYMTNRLIGDANGIDTPQSFALSEGWSDFHALLFLARAEDAAVASNANWAGVYAMGAYVLSGAANNGYYYSLRRVPYSVDVAKNALTFRHVANGQALPAGVPTAFGQNGANNAESHNAGEVWATMLWECYVALLRSPRHSFASAQDRMRRYLVASQKATPNSPTLLEARDALLAVAYATDPEDHRLFAEAFARRGAGVRAVGPARDSTSLSPVTESYSVGGDLELASATLDDGELPCDGDDLLDNGEIGLLTVSLRNVGTTRLSSTTGTLSSSTPGVSFPGGDKVTFSASEPFGQASGTALVRLDGATGAARLELSVSFQDPGLLLPGGGSQTVSFRANVDESLATSASDDVEAPSTEWTVAYDAALSAAQLWRREERAGPNRVWFAPNPEKRADVYLVSPPLQVSGAMVMTFRHRYDLEHQASPLRYFDGAVLELSEDDGQTWVDIGLRASPGYGGTVNSSGQTPLQGRRVWGAKSAGYPAMVATTVDLGQDYAGKTVRVRFRLGADDAAAAEGWEVDDIAFTGLSKTPFSTLNADPGGACTARRPMARAGEDQVVTAGQKVTLDGSASLDADGAPLSYRWTQLDGPKVKLERPDTVHPFFVAPRVIEETTLSFELVVAANAADSRPSAVRVRVLPDRTVVADCGCAAGSSWVSAGWLGVAWLVGRRRRSGHR